MMLATVALAGASGAVARFLVDAALQDRLHPVVPMGTLVVNVIGSFVMGLVTGIMIFHGTGSSAAKVVGTGFCGGLTTWSTSSWTTVRLLEEGEVAGAAVASVGNIVVSLAAAAAGLLLARI